MFAAVLLSSAYRRSYIRKRGGGRTRSLWGRGTVVSNLSYRPLARVQTSAFSTIFRDVGGTLPIKRAVKADYCYRTYLIIANWDR